MASTNKEATELESIEMTVVIESDLVNGGDDLVSDLSEVVTDFDELRLESSGESLRTQSRNFPHRSATEVDDEHITTPEDWQSLHASHYISLYQRLAGALSDPEVLSGLIKLSDAFIERAANLPFFYRSKRMRIVTLLLILYVTECISALIVVKGVIPDIVGMLLCLPLIIYFLRHLWLRHKARCTGTRDTGKKLQKMEPFADLCEISNNEFNELFQEADLGAFDYKVVGSAGDGFGFYLTQGSNRHLGEKRAVLTQDIDLNIFINTVDVKPDSLRRQSLTGARGFTWIALTEDEKSQVTDPILLKCLSWNPDINRYILSAAAISREVSKFFCAVKLNKSTIEEHFPALTLKTSISGPNGDQVYEVDYAFALRYQHWPDEASEWITRKRKGLDPVTVQNIASRGCYLVHKPCGASPSADESHNHEFDWRFTFASSEADLFHYHRDKKALKLAFVILKFLIKYESKPQGVLDTCFHNWCCLCALCKRGKKKEIPVLRTYHLKTIFLWMAEEKAHLDYYTIKGNKKLKDVFMLMLSRYQRAIRDQYLPNYFIRDRNMLAGSRYKEKDFRNAKKLLKRISSRPTLLIQENFERQFINMKIMTGILIVWLLVIFGVSLYPGIQNIIQTQRKYAAGGYNTPYYPTYTYDLPEIKFPDIDDLWPKFELPPPTERPWWKDYKLPTATERPWWKDIKLPTPTKRPSWKDSDY